MAAIKASSHKGFKSHGEPKVQDTYLHDDLANGSAIGGDVKENSGGHIHLIIGYPLTQRKRTHVIKVLI